MKVTLIMYFKSLYTAVTSSMQKSLGQGLGWIIDSVI